MKKQAETQSTDISTVPIHYVEKEVQKLKPRVGQKEVKSENALWMDTIKKQKRTP